MTLKLAERSQNSKLKKMKKQRKMQHMKEHGKNSQSQTDEEEIDSLPEKELRVMITKMIKNLGNKMKIEWKYKSSYKKCLEINNRKLTMNNIITEIENTLEE